MYIYIYIYVYIYIYIYIYTHTQTHTYLASFIRCLWTKKLLFREPVPCNPAAELQSSPWSGDLKANIPMYIIFRRNDFFFFSQTPVIFWSLVSCSVYMTPGSRINQYVLCCLRFTHCLLSLSLSACVPACLLGCLPACLLGCLPACLLSRLPACHVYRWICWSARYTNKHKQQ